MFEIKGDFPDLKIDYPEKFSMKDCKIKGSGRNLRISIEENFKANRLNIIVNSNNAELQIGSNVVINLGMEVQFTTGDNASIKVGDNTVFHGIGKFKTSEMKKISIGNGCLFASNWEILTTDYHYIWDKDSLEHLNPTADVSIGNNVWVANNVTILKGATIPDGCIIGIGSYVFRSNDLQPNSIIAGYPAKLLRTNVCWARHRKDFENRMNDGIGE